MIGGNNDAIFRRLMRVIGRPELADDPRFATNQDRLAHVDELDQIIGAWTAGVDRHEALRALEAADVPVGPIYSVADIFQDPHYWARQMLVRAEDERLGSVVVPGVAPKLSATPGGQSWLGPDLGADTDAVLHDLLGLGREQLDALRAAGVI